MMFPYAEIFDKICKSVGTKYDVVSACYDAGELHLVANFFASESEFVEVSWVNNEVTNFTDEIMIAKSDSSWRSDSVRVFSSEDVLKLIKEALNFK